MQSSSEEQCPTIDIKGSERMDSETKLIPNKRAKFEVLIMSKNGMSPSEKRDMEDAEKVDEETVEPPFNPTTYDDILELSQKQIEELLRFYKLPFSPFVTRHIRLVNYLKIRR